MTARPRLPHLLIRSLLGLVLAVEATGTVLAATRVAVPVVAASAPAAMRPATGADQPDFTRTAQLARSMGIPAPSPAVASAGEAAVSREAAVPRVPAPAARPRPVAPAYRGVNHLWIPSLGVNRAISFFSCSRSTPPSNALYRWGCAGTNNVYLFAHAYSVFQPLHDAYVAGRLRTGMVVYYADARGHVTRYRVTTWRVVTPDNVDWAIASQPRPSMTLQTCLGSRSQYRLLVRLVAG